jgi:hypothetical protein
MNFLDFLTSGLIVAVISTLITGAVVSRRKASIEDLEKHKDSPYPHSALPCAVHNVKLDIMDKKLDKLVDKLVDFK